MNLDNIEEKTMNRDPQSIEFYRHKFCFDDILLVPQYSELSSRTIPDITTHIGALKLNTPIISAPMDTITGKEMLVAMDDLDGLGILTRYINLPDGEELCRQIEKIEWAKRCGAKIVGCAIGIRDRVREKARALIDAGCDIICLDVAHGNHKKMYKAIDVLVKLKNKHHFIIMAGNVCTSEAALIFADHGVDAIKCGIGPGSCCTTRTTTGFGYPQLSAVQDTYLSIKDEYPNVSIICDGGIRSTGDMVKALWAGADAVILGYMLAGTSAAPKIDGQRIMRGMSSRMVSNRSDIAPEGIEIEVGDKGMTEKLVMGYIKGIKSGLAMAGAKSITELRNNATCVIVSSLSMNETLPRTQ